VDLVPDQPHDDGARDHEPPILQLQAEEFRAY